MDDPLSVVGGQVLARKTKITDINKKLKTHEDIVRWVKERQNHRDAIKALLVSAHHRIVNLQELGKDATWAAWVKENCKYSYRQADRIMGLLTDQREETEDEEEELEEQVETTVREIGFAIPRGPHRRFRLAKKVVENMGTEERKLFDDWYMQDRQGTIGPIASELRKGDATMPKSDYSPSLVNGTYTDNGPTEGFYVRKAAFLKAQDAEF